MITIDGSTGEGGGQILRSSLALSAITGKSVHIHHIRAGRTKPGLQNQHLKAIQATAAISQAQVEGAEMSSQEIEFIPGSLSAGRYHFDIGTAGAVTLVLQTIFLPLSLAEGSSSVTLRGGTHVPWSPSYHYLAQHWLTYLSQMGCKATIKLVKAGFYPEGGGSMLVEIHPAANLKPLILDKRGNLLRITGISAIANLDMDIAVRQKHQALRRLQPACRDTKIKTQTVPADHKGTFVFLQAFNEHCIFGACSVGAKGKRAELVADEAAEKIETCLRTPATVDENLADQLMLPMALANEASQMITSKITPHLLTNAWVIQEFLSTKIQIEGESGEPGKVIITPAC